MAMYFVQHGKAVAKEVDPDRPLSEAGLKEVQLVGAQLRRMGVVVKQIFHSGKTRARQTAELFATEIGLGIVAELSGMKPNDDVEKVAKVLDDDAMYVGHLPHMGNLVSYLTCGDKDAGVMAYSCGGVACLEKDDAGFHIKWIVTPEVCNV